MLDFERASDSSSTPPVPVGPPNDFLGKIFLNDVGLRAGWRLCLYGLFWITLSYLLQFLDHAFLSPAIHNNWILRFHRRHVLPAKHSARRSNELHCRILLGTPHGEAGAAPSGYLWFTSCADLWKVILARLASGTG